MLKKEITDIYWDFMTKKQKKKYPGKNTIKKKIMTSGFFPAVG